MPINPDRKRNLAPGMSSPEAIQDENTGRCIREIQDALADLYQQVEDLQPGDAEALLRVLTSVAEAKPGEYSIYGRNVRIVDGKIVTIDQENFHEKIVAGSSSTSTTVAGGSGSISVVAFPVGWAGS